ncbi:MAG: SpoIID/LytB domain-containing protein, partial [Thermacetogeniaceae bacterium]
AVRATAGEVLVYNGELIDPVYHSSCGGRGTEDAREVWGRDIPYLRGVPCRWDPPEKQERLAVSFKVEDMLKRLGIKDAAVPASKGEGLVRILESTATGRVRKVEVASQVFRGVDLRKALGLRSTDFTVSVKGDRVTFYTRGYGHAVGMCQYGAQGLALRGRSYREILAYYYQGAVIKKFDGM